MYFKHPQLGSKRATMRLEHQPYPTFPSSGCELQRRVYLYQHAHHYHHRHHLHSDFLSNCIYLRSSLRSRFSINHPLILVPYLFNPASPQPTNGNCSRFLSKSAKTRSDVFNCDIKTDVTQLKEGVMLSWSHGGSISYILANCMFRNQVTDQSSEIQ